MVLVLLFGGFAVVFALLVLGWLACRRESAKDTRDREAWN